jgi:hypothetical protein
VQDATPQFGTWVSYSGGDAVVLAVVLLAVAVVLLLLARRLTSPLEAERPGRGIALLLGAIWLLSILAFLVCDGAEAAQVLTVWPGYVSAVPVDPISPITDTLVVVTFVTIFVIVFYRPGGGLRQAFAGGIIGALAAPLIFELPFDLVVMARTYPPVPPDPTLYRLLFFVPLFVVEVSTFAMLALSPMVRLSRSTVIALAAMLAVFAVWAGVFGFAYPGSAGPYALNVASKILAFAAAVTLFVPEGWRQAYAARAEGPDDHGVGRVGL